MRHLLELLIFYSSFWFVKDNECWRTVLIIHQRFHVNRKISRMLSWHLQLSIAFEAYHCSEIFCFCPKEFHRPQKYRGIFFMPKVCQFCVCLDAIEWLVFDRRFICQRLKHQRGCQECHSSSLILCFDSFQCVFLIFIKRSVIVWFIFK
jgi:hypothetical protein